MSEAQAEAADTTLETRVKQVFDARINPALASHGGFVELVGVEDDKVFVRLGGGCQGCMGARMTLKAGIEQILKEEIPEVGEVVDATDHSSGDNPFY